MPRCRLKLVCCCDFRTIGTKHRLHSFIEFRHFGVGVIDVIPVLAKDPVPEARVAIKTVFPDKLDAVESLICEDLVVECVNRLVILLVDFKGIRCIVVELIDQVHA